MVTPFANRLANSAFGLSETGYTIDVLYVVLIAVLFFIPILYLVRKVMNLKGEVQQAFEKGRSSKEPVYEIVWNKKLEHRLKLVSSQKYYQHKLVVYPGETYRVHMDAVREVMMFVLPDDDDLESLLEGGKFSYLCGAPDSSDLDWEVTRKQKYPLPNEYVLFAGIGGDVQVPVEFLIRIQQKELRRVK